MFDPYHKWLGIPPQEQPPNHYRLLGLALFESNADVIDAAANRQMAYVQSCATGPHAPLSQRMLNELAAARLCLLDPARRTAYDAAIHPQQVASGRNSTSPLHAPRPEVIVGQDEVARSGRSSGEGLDPEATLALTDPRSDRPTRSPEGNGERNSQPPIVPEEREPAFEPLPVCRPAGATRRRSRGGHKRLIQTTSVLTLSILMIVIGVQFRRPRGVSFTRSGQEIRAVLGPGQAGDQGPKLNRPSSPEAYRGVVAGVNGSIVAHGGEGLETSPPPTNSSNDRTSNVSLSDGTGRQTTVIPRSETITPGVGRFLFSLEVDPPDSTVTIEGGGATVVGSEARRDIHVENPAAWQVVRLTVARVGYRTIYKEVPPDNVSAPALSIVLEREPPLLVKSGSPESEKLSEMHDISTSSSESDFWVTYDGLMIYWTIPGPYGPNVWTARRKDSGSPFEGKRSLFAGSGPSATDDGRQVFFLKPRHNRTKSMCVFMATLDADGVVLTTGRVKELEAIGFPCGLSLSADGLTMAFDAGSPDGRSQFMVATRDATTSPWKNIHLLPITIPKDLAGSKLEYPYLSQDGLSLYCSLNKRLDPRVRDIMSRVSKLMVWTRKDVSLPFEKFRFLQVDGLTGNYATSPRYLAATNELYFDGLTLKCKIDHIYVIKNYKNKQSVN